MTQVVMAGLVGLWLVATGAALLDYVRDRRYAKRYGVPLTYGCSRRNR